MSFDGFTKNLNKPLLLILGVSIVIKCILVVMSDIINPDAVRYINSAHELMQGDFKAAFRHEKMLGFTLLLGFAQVVVPDWFLAGKLLSFLPLVIVTVPLYLITRDLFGARAALITALMFSVLPYFNELVIEIVKGPLFLLCVTTSLWLVLRGVQKGKWQDLVAGGLLALLALLFRVEGIVYLVTVTALLGLFACFGPRSLGTRSRGPCFRHFLVFLAPQIVVLLLGCGAILSGIVSAENLTRIQNQFGVYFAPNLLDNYRAIYQYLTASELQFFGGQWSNDFFEFARYQLPLIYLLGLLQVFAKALFPVFLLPFAFGLARKGRWNRPLVLFLGVILGFMLMNYLFLIKNNFISSRYMMVPVVLSLVLAGHGLDRMLQTPLISGFSKLVLVVVLVLCFLAPAAKSLSVLTEKSPLLKDAGEWLDKHRDLEQTPIITNSERVVYYAGLMRGGYQVFPANGSSDYEEAALHAGSTLVVLELSAERSEKLLEFQHFKLLKEFAGNRKKILVYERLQ